MCFDRSQVKSVPAALPVAAPSNASGFTAAEGKIISISQKNGQVKVVTRRASGRLDSFTLDASTARAFGQALQNA